jgi:hypothetical protein
VERSRRDAIWAEIRDRAEIGIEPQELRRRRVYGGAQGVWVDQKISGGIAVSVLHRGRIYADELADDGLIYHYPATNRPAARDAAEIMALKMAHERSMPLFVVTAAKRKAQLRSVRRGFVADLDDVGQQCLILSATRPHLG